MAKLILPGGSNIGLGSANGNTAVYIGDSRNAQRYLDPNKWNKNAQNWSIWMDAYLRMMGKPISTIGHFAVSGTRTDQHIATQLDAAIALKPAFMFWQGFVNDIAQVYPTAGTVVSSVVANFKTMVKRCNAAGIVFVMFWERGAGNMSGTQIGQLNDINRQLADWLAWGEPGYMPNVIVIDPTPVSTTVSSNGTIVIPNSQDTVHDNIAGAKIVGLLAANKMSAHLRERPGHRLRNLSQAKVGLGSYSMIPTAAVGLAGTPIAPTGTGNSGTIPPGMNVSGCTGGVTCAYSVQATSPDADGNTWGNEVKMVVTATAPGTCGIYIALDRTGIVQGAIIRGGMEYDCAASATGLSNAYADSEWFPATGGTSPMYDFLPPASTGWGSDTGGQTNLVMEPDAFVVPAFTGTPFTNIAFRVQMNAAGTATFITRKWWAELATK